jgi:hypothetical protein
MRCAEDALEGSFEASIAPWGRSQPQPDLEGLAGGSTLGNVHGRGFGA